LSNNSANPNGLTKPDSLEYCLQLQSVKKDQDYREIYRGEQCSFRVKDLDANCEYNVRVCAVRLCYSTTANDTTTQVVHRICSPFSPHAAFTTVRLNRSNGNGGNGSHQLAHRMATHPDAKSNQASGAGSNKASSGGGGGSGAPRPASFLSKFLGTFMWRSFFTNINTKSGTKTPATAPFSSRTFSHLNAKSHLNKQKSKVSSIASSVSTANHNHNSSGHGSSGNINGGSAHATKAAAAAAATANLSSQSDSGSSDSTLGGANNSVDSKAKSRTTNDQYWALILIFILVLIAFLIAYGVNSIYMSYYGDDGREQLVEQFTSTTAALNGGDHVVAATGPSTVTTATTISASKEL
jgi:hypothetical protein